MRRAVLIVILIIVALHYGISYLLSDDFQKYADEKKAPWTCIFNNFVGGFFLTGNKHERAFKFFSYVPERCPDTPAAETAEFRMARCLEGMGRVREAAGYYDRFAKKYPKSDRAKLAIRASQVLSAS